MSNWDYNTRKQWDASPVLNELERRYLIVKTNNEKVQSITKELSEANDAAGKLSDSVNNLADDEDLEECKDDEPISDEEHFMAKSMLVNELTALSKLAANNSESDIVYHIERTIFEIEACDDE